MIGELAIRFVIGGLIVSVFSIVGGLLEPKRFAGIFGAAPSVALATLALTAVQRGSHAVAEQGHTMVFGAVAMIAYCALLSQTLRRFRLPAWLEAGAAWIVWLAIAFALWALFVRA